MCGTGHGSKESNTVKTIAGAIDRVSSFIWRLDSKRKDIGFNEAIDVEFDCGQKYMVTIERVK